MSDSPEVPRPAREPACQYSEPADDSAFSERASMFLSDRSLDALTAPRRFGRTRAVEAVAAAARASGLSVWTLESPVESPDVMVFDHWSDMDTCADVLAMHPGADVLYGQDLCHQVPAVVRLRTGNP